MTARGSLAGHLTHGISIVSVTFTEARRRRTVQKANAPWSRPLAPLERRLRPGHENGTWQLRGIGTNDASEDRDGPRIDRRIVLLPASLGLPFSRGRR